MHRPARVPLLSEAAVEHAESRRGPIRVGGGAGDSARASLVPAWVVRRQIVLRQHGSCCRLTGGVTASMAVGAAMSLVRVIDRTATFTVTVPK